MATTRFAELEEINPTCAESTRRAGLTVVAMTVFGEDDYYQFVETRQPRNAATSCFLTHNEAFWFMQGIWCARMGK